MQTAPWTRLPAAATILADLAANPPEQRCHTTRYGNAIDRDYLYTGAKARQLRAIYRAEAERLLAEGDASGDHSAFRAHCAMTVDEAIEAAVKAAPIARRAA